MGEFRHVHVQKRGVVVQLEDRKLQFAPGKIQGVRGGAAAQQVHDFITGALLGEKHHVQAHVLEQQFVLGGEIGFVVDTGNHALGAQLLGQKGAYDIDALLHPGVDGDEKVGSVAAGIFQDADGGRWALDGDDIGLGGK